MATKYSMSVRIDNNWEPVALFSDTIPVSTLQEMGKALWEKMSTIDDVYVLDMDTGEILWNGADAQEYEEPAYDLDCGFNPYSGCYDFDC